MIYKDKTKSIDERVEDLMQRMTVDEKIAQLYCANAYGGVPVIDNKEEKLKNGIGTISYLNDSLTGNNKKDIETLNAIQKYLVEETRLGIPGLVHNEGIAGAQIPGATTFPQSLNMAATWEPRLAKKMGEVVKKQLMAYGIRAVHSPLFDLGRDPRWGRIGETYGEDPYLVSQMGVSYVRGVQGDDEVMATAKHFVGYGNAEGGINGGAQQIAERKLLDTYCVPFEAAIHEAGLKAVMNSYGIVNEEAVSTSKWLLTDILRHELGFKGLVVADYGSISHARTRYRVAKDDKEAAVLALKAGMDVEQPGDACYQFLKEALEGGEIGESEIDRSLKRILTMKFKLGLFENPYHIGTFDTEIASQKAADLSKEIAKKSIVMVKNEAGTLPIKKGLKIALIGPSADTKANFFGGYSAVGSADTKSSDFDKSEEDHRLKVAYSSAITEYKETFEEYGIMYDEEPSAEQKEIIMAMIKQNYTQTESKYGSAESFIDTYYPDCQTIKQVMENTYGQENIIYAKGCEIKQSIESGVEAAQVAVSQADIVVAVLGGKESMIDAQATSGENRDNSNIDLEKPQIELMQAIYTCGKPVVAVLVDSRPLSMPLVNAQSAAVLYTWVAAQSSAEAIVNVLTGAHNPSGKLPVTIVKEASQIPMYSSRVALEAELTTWASYIDENMNEPLYPFGYGLSYTTFNYHSLTLSKSAVKTDETLIASFKIENSGTLKGDEIVQVYVRDHVASVARPVKQLVGFTKVSLEAGEVKKVHLELNMRQLAFHDINGDQVIEPGDMTLYIGSSSQDIRLQDTFEIVGDKQLVDRRVFTSKITIIDK